MRVTSNNRAGLLALTAAAMVPALVAAMATGAAASNDAAARTAIADAPPHRRGRGR
ncbi:hypothetical protein [Fodinicola feengrottensis]|uniref:hypothetical protein n=1 Tax=Fodinicola feengrottensis TaxID=435914 RepID=UPI0013D0FE7A|nr:hypothetical protein [Fodinicola feengrottensis]